MLVHIPSIKTKPFTGDILQSAENKKLFLIVTPACDLVHKKPDQQVAIAEIEDLDMEAIKIAKSKMKSQDADKRELGQSIILGLIKNTNSAKYHFLPPTCGLPGGFINFQKILCVNYDDIAKKYNKIASVSERFTKDIISHFSLYYARQGQPDLDFESLYTYIVNL
jgi:hypothetical protein